MKRLLLTLALSIALILTYAQKDEQIRIPEKNNTVLNFVMNDEFQLDSIIRYKWDIIMEEWIPSYHCPLMESNCYKPKLNYKYDEFGNLIYVASYEWNDEINKWVILGWVEHGYNNNGDVILEFYNPQGDAPEGYRYVYDDQGNIILKEEYEWSNTRNDWIKVRKHQYVFDENGNQLLYIYSYKDEPSNEWISKRKSVYEYEGQNNKSLTQYTWDYTVKEWVGTYFTEYSYDERGNEILTIQYGWDKYNSNWVEYRKEVYVYDDQNKRTLSETYDWDAIVNKWIGNEMYNKHEVAYDEQNNTILHIKHIWNKLTNKWVYESKEIRDYDTYGNTILLENYIWDKALNQWIGKNIKEVSAYDEKGNQILSENYEWENNLRQWIGLDNRRVYEFDKSGISTLIERSYWDMTTLNWIIDFKRKNIYTYDDNENKKLYESYFCLGSDSVWFKDRMKEYTYNENGKLTFVESYYRSDSDSIWKKTNITEYAYDDQNNVILYKYFYWHEIDNVWVEKEKEIYVNDSHGNILLKETYLWNSTEKALIKRNKYEYKYDEKGNIISEIMYYWSNNVWHGIHNTEYRFDEYDNKILQLDYRWIGNWRGEKKTEWYYCKKGTSYIQFRISDNSLTLEAPANITATFDIASNLVWSISGLNSWLNADITSGNGNATITLTAEENTALEPRIDTLLISTNELSVRYVFVTQSGTALSINEEYIDEINIYPNPVKNELAVNLVKDVGFVKVYDLSGKRIMQGVITDTENSINVSGFGNGLYILEVVQGDKVYRSKFVKQ
ncbi:T9SS type A sorting domain-containing protein [Saccharicrinis sp. FJH62]|uniref:T9SS type A sorting domain-containing protein n=1 Tax=Saccharicrinis sp. FJH62 TaxID=3344657 RepID=UPI0035D4645F